jgi:hypothetical protein
METGAAEKKDSPETKAELMSVIGQLLEAQQERAMDLIFLGNSPKDAREYGRLSE